MEPTTEHKGFVVSDLHIFGSSSLYKRYLSALYDSASKYPVVVLNGDTFDFKRSMYPSALLTTERAIVWLRELCERCPATTFHYIVGNHDCKPALLNGIASLSHKLPNLHAHPVSTRIGDCLFVHGDMLDAGEEREGLPQIRSPYETLEPSSMSKVWASIVTRLRINAIEYVRHNRHRVVPRLLRYLQTTQPQTLLGVTAIYFGHTHVPFQDFSFEGIRFHNTGSLIRGLRWMPLEFPLGK